MQYTRRTVIIGAGLTTATPKLVKATSLLDIPGGIGAAKRWAVESFSENPGCRLVFADGTAYRWMNYGKLWRRPAGVSGGPVTYAVALEICVTDAEGRRMINSVPVDGVGLTRIKEDREAASKMRQFNGWSKELE